MSRIASVFPSRSTVLIFTISLIMFGAVDCIKRLRTIIPWPFKSRGPSPVKSKLRTLIPLKQGRFPIQPGVKAGDYQAAWFEIEILTKYGTGESNEGY